MVVVVGDRLFYGRGTKCVFLGFCCVDATLMMGVMGWGGGDGNPSSFEMFLFEVHIILLVLILEDVKHESAIES